MPTAPFINPRLKTGSLLLATGLLLSGCGGGGGGNDSTTSGQSTDPTAVEFPVAYVQRPQLAANAPIPDLRNPFAFTAGAKLFVRSRADAAANETCVTCAIPELATGAGDMYDVKDLDVSPDGSKLIFAAHAPMILNARPENQPTWQIWEYDFKTQVAARIIKSNNQAQLGNAVSPHYLLDGRIVFVSDEQKGMRANLLGGNPPAPVYSGLNESGNRKAGVLHVMDGDGLNVSQVSYNQSHDLFPWILKSGKILFSRWDNFGGTDRSLNLYTINPDGSSLSSLYGFYSHDGTNTANELQFAQPREMEDGRILSILRRFQSTSLGGDMIAIDVNRYSEQTQPTWQNLGLGGTAQATLAVNTITTDGTLSPGGQFGAAYPLWDGSNRLIVSWAQCFALNGTQRVPCAVAPAGATPAPPEYGIWVYTPGTNPTQRPVVTAQTGVIFTDVVAGAPRKSLQVATKNDVFADPIFNSVATSVVAAGQGVLDIRSINNLDNLSNASIANQVDPSNPAYKLRSARFLRLLEAVPKPDRQDPDPTPELDNFVLGLSNTMRHIIGYVPIEPDGSVAVRVPANTPFTFQIVDANGKRIGGTHDVWWQVGVGEVLRCGGCHSATSQQTHGRLDSPPPSANPGATLAGSMGGFVVSPLHDANLKGSVSGQNMAEVYSLNRPLRSLSVDMKYTDEWATNAGQQNPAFDFSYKIGAVMQVPVAPTVTSCLTTPSNSCRSVINYVDHIQSIWDKAHPYNSTMVTCTSCHSAAAPGGVFNAGQLDLTSTSPSRDADRVASWAELFTNDVKVDVAGAQILVNGAQIFDAQGNPVLDGMGQPTFTQVTVPVGHVMNSGASASPLFFGCFVGGQTCGTSGAATVNHVGMLNGSELRLIAEWLDIGAQYFNDVAKANTASN